MRVQVRVRYAMLAGYGTCLRRSLQHTRYFLVHRSNAVLELTRGIRSQLQGLIR
jgi:hypothetical protein